MRSFLLVKGDDGLAMTDYRYNAKIYLPTLQNILFFVGCATCCNFGINISKKGFSGYMNGKSLVGMIVLAGTDALNVHYNGYLKI